MQKVIDNGSFQTFFLRTRAHNATGSMEDGALIKEKQKVRQPMFHDMRLPDLPLEVSFLDLFCGVSAVDYSPNTQGRADSW